MLPVSSDRGQACYSPSYSIKDSPIANNCHSPSAGRATAEKPYNLQIWLYNGPPSFVHQTWIYQVPITCQAVNRTESLPSQGPEIMKIIIRVHIG